MTAARYVPGGGAAWADPWPPYAALRDHDPVHRVVPAGRPEHDYYVLTRHADVAAAAVDATRRERWLRAAAVAPAAVGANYLVKLAAGRRRPRLRRSRSARWISKT